MLLWEKIRLNGVLGVSKNQSSIGRIANGSKYPIRRDGEKHIILVKLIGVNKGRHVTFKIL